MWRTETEQNGDQNLLRILSAVLSAYRLPKPPEESVLGESMYKGVRRHVAGSIDQQLRMETTMLKT